ncbi:polysaccharide deacetylase family protein [Peribacillus frigoritolerans]|uniref:polysaccharide deacetylase family protein n=1 Tax=Peribacillus frigoritolerans TaxID=450367 RepID=UPI002E239A96|nr:polysaccharide deacetylase family protein [Peribacillus frigoritolerans]MED3993747.1 polysaccharide deacetylase family protein [Peribacillus frigoritolerans]
MLKKVTGLIVFILVFLPIFEKTAMAVTYTVQPGDTLSKISDKYGTSVDKVVNLNKLLSTILEPGQQLEVPKTYISKGETLYNISIKLGVSIPELIRAANPKIKNHHWIYSGQIINVPIKNEMIYMGNPSKKRIALTFDDGPEDIYTPQILDILRQKGVKATFFVVGKQAREYPELLKQIYREGHAIGNHTWDHSHLPDLTNQQLIENVQFTTAEIEKITGLKTDLFRPPYGEIQDQQVALLNNRGYRSIMWTADTMDWSGVSAEDIQSRVKQNASPGVIVLQHNYHASGKFETVKALPQIIDQLRAQGYEFVTVPTLLGK